MEMDTYMRFVLALLFVLALIGILAWLARKAGLGGRVARAKGTKRRLSIIEVSPIDGKRRLVLVRRDGVEHLVLLGASSETVIETGIEAPEQAAAAPDAADDTDDATSFKQQVAAKMGNAVTTKRGKKRSGSGTAKPSRSGAGA